MRLATAYFPPVQFFTKLIGQKEVEIEACEHYQKQSYRNRCHILGANGLLTLHVPITKGHSPGQAIREVRIDYQTNWQRVHVKSVESAYKHAPYFEYYIDDIIPFWTKRYTYLFDMNLSILSVMRDLLEMEVEFRPTREYLHTDSGQDNRQRIHPKVSWDSDDCFSPIAYQQVFSDRFDFLPNLSILDLLFMKGPDSISVLASSKK